MKREWKKFSAAILCSALVLTSATQIMAQQPRTERNVVIEQLTQSLESLQEPQPGSDKTFVYVASEMNFDGKLVKGAPYSAQTINETTQVLADGNRIINRSTGSVYRDSEGRTRREHSLQAIGPFANLGELPLTISISDPVAGVNYALDPRSKVAHKMAPMRFEFKMMAPDREGQPSGPLVSGSTSAPEALPEGVSVRTQVFTREAAAPAAGGGAGFVMELHGQAAEKGKTESLGKQNMEGVEAEGSRTTVTIPAGEIGNERAIDVVSERWYSPDLQVVVMTRHSDPRFGETSYRLTNINRSDPDKSLFRVPADYTISDQEPFNRVRTGIGGGTGSGIGSGTGSGIMSEAVGAKMISGGILNGKAISLPMPEYPITARQAHASGTVTVQITIDEEGTVVAAHAISGHPLLQAAGVAAARQAKFSPTKLQGQGVKVTGVVTYNFVPEE